MFHIRARSPYYSIRRRFSSDNEVQIHSPGEVATYGLADAVEVEFCNSILLNPRCAKAVQPIYITKMPSFEKTIVAMEQVVEGRHPISLLECC